MRLNILRSTKLGVFLVENLGKNLETRTHSRMLLEQTCLKEVSTDVAFTYLPPARSCCYFLYSVITIRQTSRVNFFKIVLEFTLKCIVLYYLKSSYFNCLRFQAKHLKHPSHVRNFFLFEKHVLFEKMKKKWH